jgi:pimeloyl-ACP methyl ester carboxylesterase
LIVYVTGDGGWPGDERLFDRMLPFGFPMAGFSSIDYVFEAINPASRTIDPPAIAADFQRVIDAAGQALKLPKDHPVVLIGFSRGASLSIAAAGVPVFRTRLQGVVALALAADDVFVANAFEPYAALMKLDPLKVVVIQSTRDEILSAAEARRRLGADTATRRLHAIDARDHSFGGKLDELIAEIRASLDWLRR